MNTAYNISRDKLSKYLNRLSAIDKLTLSMVKTTSKKNKSAIIAYNMQATNSGNWTNGQCKEFLEKYKALKNGTKAELQKRCVLTIELKKEILSLFWLTK